MSLNIKNPETHALIRELARLKGVSMTAAVTAAVQEEIRRTKANTSEVPDSPESRYERLRSHVRQYARLVPAPIHSWEIDAYLYDENGLPR